ncbi:hypothetical protein V8E53_007441 [Lactarius tabidus]|jgi:hypothetical protein
MKNASGRDGGRTQSGGIRDVIAPDPGQTDVTEPDDPDGTITRRRAISFFLSLNAHLYILHAQFHCYHLLFSHPEICARPALYFVGWLGMAWCVLLALAGNLAYVCSAFIWT